MLYSCDNVPVNNTWKLLQLYNVVLIKKGTIKSDTQYYLIK